MSFYERLCEIPFLQRGSFKVAWLNGTDNAPLVPFPLDFILPVCVLSSLSSISPLLPAPLPRVAVEYNDALFSDQISNAARDQVEKVEWLRQEYGAHQEEGLCYLFDQPSLDISSTSIRRSVSRGLPLSHYFHPSHHSDMADYIHDHSLWLPLESVPSASPSSEEKEKEGGLGIMWGRYLPRWASGEKKTRAPRISRWVSSKERGEFIRVIKESQPVVRNENFWVKEKEEDEDMKKAMAKEGRERRKRESRVKFYTGTVPSTHTELDAEILSGMLYFGGVIDGPVAGFRWER